MAGLDKVIRTIAIAALLVVGACSQKMAVTPPASGGASGSGGPVEGFTTFPDMPMPVCGEIDVERTLIFGTGEAWFGRMVVNTSHNSGDMFTFYRESLPGFGWKEITAVRAAVSVLTYVREDRVATIQIQARTIRGSEVTITVSPHGAPVTPAATIQQPRAPVQTQTIR